MKYNILYIQGVTIMGGAPRSLIELASRLDRERFQPLILTSHKGQFTRELADAGLEYRLVPMGMWRKGKNFPLIPFTLYRIYRLLKREKIALVHANTLWDNPYASLPADWCGIPAVCHIRSVPRPDMIRKYLLDRASRLITVSEHIKQALGEGGGAPMVTIYNGIDLAYGRLEGVAQRVRAELGFSVDNVVVGMISRLDPLKGQETLIQAAKRVVDRYPQVRFLIAGEPKNKTPEYLQRLKFMVKSASLECYFVFTGYRRNFMELAAALDVSVLPSLSEGFGRTNLEAMVLKKPVISSNIGGIPEVVEDGVTGFLVPPDDPQSLAQRIMELVGDKDKRQQMGERGYRRVVEKFDLNQQVRKIEQLYEELLNLSHS
jgi:glycosyltransferase involved in cell wall biosynthesis